MEFNLYLDSKWTGLTSSIDASNPNWIVLETIIMAEDGGFTIREAGIYDDQGDLLAIGKYPETYKPVMSEGSSKDLYVRMILEVTNSATVELKVDPTVILATKKDLSELKREVTEPKYSEPLTVLESIHRLENTVKGQVSVGLKGQTLTNKANNGINYENWLPSQLATYNVEGITWIGNGIGGHAQAKLSNEFMKLKDSTQYTLLIFSSVCEVSSFNLPHILGGSGYIVDSHVDIPDAFNLGINKFLFTTKSGLVDTDLLFLYLDGTSFSSTEKIIFRVMILEGDWTNKNVNYIDGTKSTINHRIKSIGKNLFPGQYVDGYVNSTTGLLSEGLPTRRTIRIHCKEGETYIISGGNRNVWRFEDIDKNYITHMTSDSVTAPSNAYYMIVYYSSDGKHEQIQIEKGLTVTSYEEYQESTSYIVLPGGEALRSLPSGIKDEIRDKKLYKRTVKSVLQSGDIDSLDTSNMNLDRVVIGLDAFSSLADQTNEVDNSFYVEGFGSEVRLGDADLLTSEYKYSTGTVALLLLVPKGTYVDLAAAQADLAGTALIYQLAQVDVIENGERGFSITGSLETFNGETTIITEPYLRKPYTTHSTSITLDYTIEAIDKLLVFQNGSFIGTSGTLSLDGKTITVSESGIYQVEGKIKSEEHGGHELVVTHPLNTSGSLESIGDLANTNASLIGDYGRKLSCIGNAYMALQLGLNQQGTTAERPKNPMAGDMYFDTILSRPIWYNGSGWIDAAGTAV